jgi:hydroxypyruvate reductase 1
MRLQVVSLHCLLDHSTKHLINAQRLSLMKKDALLINAARGPIVDETALVAHLKADPNLTVVSEVSTCIKDFMELSLLPMLL